MGGGLLLQCAKCPLVPVDGAAEAKREPRDLPGRPRGSPASQGDDSASDFDPQGRTGPRYDCGELSNRARANVADSPSGWPAHKSQPPKITVAGSSLDRQKFLKCRRCASAWAKCSWCVTAPNLLPPHALCCSSLRSYCATAAGRPHGLVTDVGGAGD
jgi:hypothetical protein